MAGIEILLENEVNAGNVSKFLAEQIKENEILLFMKGNAMMPQCGFSAQVTEILNRLGVDFKTFNVLSNAEVREGIKKFSNWPTIPQVYYKGEFLGGCDIMMEMYQSGELDKTFGLSA